MLSLCGERLTSKLLDHYLIKHKMFEVYYISLLGYEFSFFHLKFGIMQEMLQKHVWCLCTAYGQESESAEIGFLWGPKHEQFSNASLSALNLKKHFEN